MSSSRGSAFASAIITRKRSRPVTDSSSSAPRSSGTAQNAVCGSAYASSCAAKARASGSSPSRWSARLRACISSIAHSALHTCWPCSSPTSHSAGTAFAASGPVFLSASMARSRVAGSPGASISTSTTSARSLATCARISIATELVPRWAPTMTPRRVVVNTRDFVSSRSAPRSSGSARSRRANPRADRLGRRWVEELGADRFRDRDAAEQGPEEIDPADQNEVVDSARVGDDDHQLRSVLKVARSDSRSSES